MKKIIFLSGGWGYGNIGDEAILRCTLSSLAKKFVNIEIIISSFDPDNTYFHHKTSSIPSLHRLIFLDKFKLPISHIISSFAKFISILIWLFFNYQGFITKAIKQYLDKLSTSDIFVMAGGGYFNDDWLTSFYAHILEIAIALKLKKPCLIAGQTLGPFRHRINHILLKLYLPKVSAICVRDSQSKELIQRIVPNASVSLGADEVNKLSDLYKSDNGSLSQEYNVGIIVQQFRPYVSINQGFIVSFGNRLYSKFIKLNSIHYYKALSEIVDYLISKFHAEVIFLPSTSWDVSACEKVIKKCTFKDLISLHKDLCLDEYIKRIMKCNLVISTNMHPLIIASALDIPVIGISYWYKMDDFMKSLNALNRLWPINNINTDAVISTIDDIYSNLDKYRCQTNINMKINYDLAERNTDILSEYIS